MTELRNQDGGLYDPIWGDEFYEATYNPGDDDDEAIGWECICCGNLQETQMGLQCDRCGGPLCEVYV